MLDPFAGGSVRGVVASKLGRRYLGIDLSQRQIDANRLQGKAICGKDNLAPEWIVGDSAADLDKLVKDGADCILTCPPYADLEVYSDHPRDISDHALRPIPRHLGGDHWQGLREVKGQPFRSHCGRRCARQGWQLPLSPFARHCWSSLTAAPAGWGTPPAARRLPLASIRALAAASR